MDNFGSFIRLIAICIFTVIHSKIWPYSGLEKSIQSCNADENCR